MADTSVAQHADAVQCRVCGGAFPQSNFYEKQIRKSGDVGECKDCTKRRVKDRSRVNPDVREYDRARAKLPHRKAAARQIAKRWREKHPEAYAAQTAVGYAVKTGRLVKMPCVFCEDDKLVHAHHRDYSKPLDVIWLCPKCHHRLHAMFPETAAHEPKS